MGVASEPPRATCFCVGGFMAVDVAVKRAIIYLRVSSTRQEDNASLPTQEQAARNYCGRHGYAIVDVCREIHTGQELWERDVLTDVRARIRRGEANVLLAYSVDRLARDPDHQAIVIGEAVHHGCDVEFVDEPPDDSPEAGLIRYVKAYAGKR